MKLKLLISLILLILFSNINCYSQSFKAIKNEVINVLSKYDNHTSCYPDKSWIRQSHIDIEDYKESKTEIIIYGILDVKCYPSEYNLENGLTSEIFFFNKVPIQATIKLRGDEFLVKEIIVNSVRIYPRMRF